MFNKKESNPSNKMINEAITSIIGEDMNVVGDLISTTSIRIDGKVSGNITSQKLIIVGEKAEIKGDLSSKSIIVFGKLLGNIAAGEIQIKKTGIINGDISTQVIEIEMGGKYNGKLMMNEEQKELNGKLKVNESQNKVVID